jgi:pilus assembly protein CpaE
MPDDGLQHIPRPEAPQSQALAGQAPPGQALARHDRPELIAFVTDAQSEAALRTGLADAVAEAIDLRRGNIRAAIATLEKVATPRLLLVDVSGEEEPLAALCELSNVVEPDVRVLVVGERDNLDFYREITRGLGVTEYLPKPLTRDKVARHFGAIVAGQAPSADGVLGGRAVTITGVRGGVGATTIAVNLAWHFGVQMRRHTVLIDPDLHRGTASFMLNMPSGAGLRMALEAPERIDALLAERAAQPVADRLHVLSGEERLGELPVHAHGAAERLLDALLRRYGAIVVDAPFAPVPLYRDLIDLVHQRVLVLDPSLAAVRDTLRLLTLPHGSKMRQRAVVVLNRVGIAGGLTRRQVEDALKMKVDVAIPDLPRQLGQAATMGEPAVLSSSGFRNGIVELAKQIGFVSMPDAIALPGDAARARRRPWWRLGRRG